MGTEKSPASPGTGDVWFSEHPRTLFLESQISPVSLQRKHWTITRLPDSSHHRPQNGGLSSGSPWEGVGLFPSLTLSCSPPSSAHAQA